MANTRLYSILEAKIGQQRRVVLDSMGDGACPDYPSYRDQCGYLRGLDAALALMEEIERDGAS